MMMTQLIFQSNPWLLPTLMFVVLGLSIELPYRFGRSLARYMPKADPFNVIQTALLTLAAFVLALSFNQASARFDTRRALVISEANAIGTTWLRADQLESGQSKRFRRILTDYTAARLRAYETPRDPRLYRNTIDQSNRDQAELWTIVSSSLRAHETTFGISLLMQSLNDTIDLTLALVTLGTLSLGLRFAMSQSRPVILSALYVIAYVLVINMMVDYDRPNTGFVTVSLTPLKLQLESMQGKR